ncbi:MAG: malate dehydrogenase [Candidatus Omnitrophica bacterium]|nr:malate dehydrogenase [Candidatus Omnitrophota bacterium]
MERVKKISIIGVGSVGSTLAFNILKNLGIEELILIDIAGSLAKGVALDLEDTRAFLEFSTKILGTSNINHIKNSDIIVVTAGKARSAGMTRYDLLNINKEIAKKIAKKIKEVAPTSLVIVITNPVDFITYVIKKETGFERERIIGMGSSLDSARLLNLVYQMVKISPSSIETMVLGMHSKDMLPLVKKCKVKGISIDKFLSQEKIKLISEKTKIRGKEIVELLKNRSAHFAPSLAGYQLIEAIVKDKKEIICVSTYLNGEYGIKNVCIGVPCIIGRKGIIKIIEIELGREEKEKLLKSANYFRECMSLQ